MLCASLQIFIVAERTRSDLAISPIDSGVTKSNTKNKPKSYKPACQIFFRTSCLTYGYFSHLKLPCVAVVQSANPSIIRGVRLGNLDLDFIIRISDLQSNAKSEKGLQRWDICFWISWRWSLFLDFTFDCKIGNPDFKIQMRISQWNATLESHLIWRVTRRSVQTLGKPEIIIII